jgi:hypothetical protein
MTHGGVGRDKGGISLAAPSPLLVESSASFNPAIEKRRYRGSRILRCQAFDGSIVGRGIAILK